MGNITNIVPELFSMITEHRQHNILKAVCISVMSVPLFVNKIRIIEEGLSIPTVDFINIVLFIIFIITVIKKNNTNLLTYSS